MAIYHVSAKVISRGKGQSSVASASYRAGEKYYDSFYGKTYDYTNKKVTEKYILAPDNSPKWVYNREYLWNKVESGESRIDSQLAREFNFALPKELNQNQQIELVLNFVKKNFVELGMVADICFHLAVKKNPHAHVMLTMRKLLKNGFGNKERYWNSKDLLLKWRENWAKEVNLYLERNFINQKIDHRSYEARGLEIFPTIHLGHKVCAMEKKGIITDRGNINRSINKYNKKVFELEKYKEKKLILSKQKNNYNKLIKAIEKNIKDSKDKEDFIKNMKIDGYNIKWVNHHKYMTYITPDGLRFRDRRLPEKFSKDNLDKYFSKINIQIKNLSNEIEKLKLQSCNIEYKLNKLEKSISKFLKKSEIKETKESLKKVEIEITKRKEELSKYKNKFNFDKNKSNKNNLGKKIEGIKKSIERKNISKLADKKIDIKRRR